MKAMKIKAIPQDTLLTLLAENGPDPSPGETVKGRRALAGNRTIPAGDKRRKSPTERRDVQFNIKITAQVRDMILKGSRDLGMSQPSFIDHLVHEYMKKGGK